MAPEKLTPRRYATYRSKATGTIVQPQLIYYYVRKGLILLEDCPNGCGTRVLDVKLTDDFFDTKDKR